MSKKPNLRIDPFEGDFGDGEIEYKRAITDIPRCFECSEPFKDKKCVTKIDYEMDFDDEKMRKIEIFYWHLDCYPSHN